MQIPSPPFLARLPSFGFSLVEIAVVLVIIAVLTTIIAVPLTAQLDQQRVVETTKQLEGIKEAIHGFAVANGRLPCPAIATSTSTGIEAFTGAACTTNYGFVPAATLGLAPVDARGFSIDAWGIPQNRIRYAVANVSIVAGTPAICTATTPNALTTAGSMRTATMDCLSNTAMLTVTSTTVANAAAGCTPIFLTTKAPFVLLSLGKNAATGGMGADEAANLQANATTFVSHLPTATTSCAGEFDDIVTWGNLNTLFSRMVQAGKLP